MAAYAVFYLTGCLNPVPSAALRSSLVPMPSLLRVQRLQFQRALQARYGWLAFTALVLAVAYVAALLILLGFLFEEIAGVLGLQEAPIVLVDRFLLSVFVGLFALRFFFQRTPRMKMVPYLHLPIARRTLVFFFQGLSLLTIHNLIPLFFVVPFWYRYVRPAAPDGGLSWVLGIVLLLAAATVLNNWLRVVLSRSTYQFFVVVAALALLFSVDQFLGQQVMSRLSSAFFDALLAGNVAVLLGVLAGTVALFIGSSRHLGAQLHATPDLSHDQLEPGKAVDFEPGRGVVHNLMLLEMKLIWRNKRPRHYLLMSFFFGTLYLALMLIDLDFLGQTVTGAVVGLFASGIFALNYGQLMFAWESAYFDGMLSRDIDLRRMVLAKLLLLQGSCAVFFLVSLPFFFLMAPELLLLHVAFLFYNAGITSVLMLTLAVRNRQRVNTERGGGFFNYEGFSLLHWLWLLPTIAPPLAVLYTYRQTPAAAFVLIGGLGAISLLLNRPWSYLFARLLARRKHEMAMGFRTHET